MLRLDRASGVEVPRLQRGRLDERIEARGGRSALLAERSQPPILHPAGFDADLRLGPAADRAEHLRPRQGQLHGEPDLLRRQRADEHVRPRRSFAAERAADEFRQHADVLFGKLERRGQLVTNGEHPLGGVVDGQPVRRGPLRDGRVRLHRIVDLRRNLILLVEFRVRGAQTVRHVAVRGIRRSFAPSRHDVLWERLVERVFEMDGVGLGRGPHAHEQCSVRGPFQAGRDDDSDGLVAVQDAVVLQHLDDPIRRIEVRSPGQPRRIPWSDHRQYTACAPSGLVIDLQDATTRHAARYQHAVHRVRNPDFV